MLMAERINGIKTHLDRWSDAEVVNGIEYAVERRREAERDLNTLLGAAGMRGLIQPEAVTEHLPTQDQGQLFVIEHPDGDLPPAA